MCSLRGAERGADDGALDPAESAPSWSPRFERFLGGDEVPGRRTFEIVRLHPADPNVAVPEQSSLDALLSDEISLSPWPFSARRPHALAAAQWPRGALIGSNRRFAVFSGVDERSSRRLRVAVVARAFTGAITAVGGSYVGVRR